VNLWDSRFSSLMKRLFDNFQVIANTNLELPDILSYCICVYNMFRSDLSQETTRVVIRLLIDP
ncbi:unnamed protein product, partial [Brassica rapa]